MKPDLPSCQDGHTGTLRTLLPFAETVFPAPDRFRVWRAVGAHDRIGDKGFLRIGSVIAAADDRIRPISTVGAQVAASRARCLSRRGVDELRGPSQDLLVVGLVEHFVAGLGVDDLLEVGEGERVDSGARFVERHELVVLAVQP